MKPTFQLARIGSTLFPSTDMSTVVMAQVGVASERILLEQPAISRWYAIVNECAKADLVPSLVEEMLEYYPEHAGLLKLRTVSKRSHLCVAVGSDPALGVDLDSMRAVRRETGMEFVQIKNVTLAKLSAVLARERANEQPVNLHLAVHAGVQGVLFEDTWIAAEALSDILTGVQLLVLAGCDGGTVLDGLHSVPQVIGIDAKVTHSDAALFTRLFWTAIGQHIPAEGALQRTLPRLPNGIREYIFYRG